MGLKATHTRHTTLSFQMIESMQYRILFHDSTGQPSHLGHTIWPYIAPNNNPNHARGLAVANQKRCYSENHAEEKFFKCCIDGSTRCSWCF